MEDNYQGHSIERTVIVVVLSYDRCRGVNVVISSALRTSKCLIPFALML